MASNSNIIIIILVIVIVVFLIYYLGRNNNSTVPNDGVLENYDPFADSVTDPNLINTVNPEVNMVLDSIISDYEMEISDGTAEPMDPMATTYAKFDDYIKKDHVDNSKMEKPFSSRNVNPSEFSYKKKKYRIQGRDEIEDQFDIDQMLPRESNEDWFDAEPLMTTQRIGGRTLIDPAKHIGINTVNTSNKNISYDIRGTPPVPKLMISPFNNSTIEPEYNNGLCS